MTQKPEQSFDDVKKGLEKFFGTMMPPEMQGYLQQVLDLPSVKAMYELETWATERGLDNSDARHDFIRCLVRLIQTTKNHDAVRGYSAKAVDLLIEAVPSMNSFSADLAAMMLSKKSEKGDDHV